MAHRFRATLGAALLVFAAGAGAFTVDELVAKNVEAKGGAAALGAVKSLRRSGRLVVGGGQYVLEIVETKQRPEAIRVELSLQGLTQIQAYDGHEGWQIDPFGGRRDPERMAADDLKGLIEDADIGGPLVDWQARGSKVEYLGTEDIDGTAAHKLKVTRSNGDLQYVYLDPDHFLEIRVESQRTVRGVRQITFTELGNYEEVAGVFWPLSMENGRRGSSDTSKIEFEKAEVNQPLDPQLFAFPTVATKGGQP
jgi:hypothetical protein